MATASQGRKLSHEILMLEVVEQPKSTGLQFVKPGQMPSTECYVTGEKSTMEKMTYPSILLTNYEGPAKLVWYLISDDALHPHPYILEGEDCKDGVCTKTIQSCGQIVSLPSLYVRSVPTKDVSINLDRRIIFLKEHLPGTEFLQKDPTEYNLNTARICFRVLPQVEEMVKMVMTRCLHRKDPVLPRDPCILSVSQCKGLVYGGEEMSLQVTNLKTDDLLVFFHYESLEPRTSWQAFADVICVSRKKGQPVNIVIRTPAYYNQKITKPQTVAIQVRLTDYSCSNTVNFTYTPQTKGPSKIEQKAKQKEPVYVRHFSCLGAVAQSGQVLTADGQKRVDGADKFDRTKDHLMLFVQRKQNQPYQIRKPQKANIDHLTEEPMELLEGWDSEKELGTHEERVDQTRVDWYKSLLMETQSSPLDATLTVNVTYSQHSSKAIGSKNSNPIKQLSHEVNLQSESPKEGPKSDWPLNYNDDIAKSENGKHHDQEMDFESEKGGHSFTTCHSKSPVIPEIVETLDDVNQKDPGFSSPLPSLEDSSPSSTQTHHVSDEILSLSSSLDSGIYAHVPSPKMSSNLSVVHETNSSIGEEVNCVDSSDGEFDENEVPKPSGTENTQMSTSTTSYSETAAETENKRNDGVNESNPSGDGKENAGQASCLSPPRATKRIDHKGGKLTLFDGEITLDIPPGALREGQAEDITLTVDWDDRHIPRLRKIDMNVAPIVHCGPTGLKFEKPVILRIPHCAVVKPNQKGLQTVLHCSNTEEGAIPRWQEVSTLDNPDIDVEYQDHCFILHVTHFTEFSVTLPGGTSTLTKEIMAVAYGPEIKTFAADQEIRVHLYDFNGSNRERIHQEELNLGGKQLDGPCSYMYHELHQGKMTVQAKYGTPGWLLKSASPKIDFSFCKIWNAQSWSRCKFTWSNGSENAEFRCRVGVQQERNDEVATLEISNHVKITPELSQPKPQSKNEFPASSDVPPEVPHFTEQYSQERKTYIRSMSYGVPRRNFPGMAGPNPAINNMSVDLSSRSYDSGLANNCLPDSNIVPYSLKQRLCHLLDRKDNALGNDWRKFAEYFGFDEYIRNWEDNCSPTTLVLNTIQQQRKIHTLKDLRKCFVKIKRLDAAKAVEDYEVKHAPQTTQSIQPSDHDSDLMSDTPSPDDVIHPLTANSMDWSPSSDEQPQMNRPLAISTGQSPAAMTGTSLFNGNLSQNKPVPNSASTSGLDTPWNCHTDENRNMEANDQGVKRTLFNE